jgi:catabolite regulation protein CreA
MRLSLISLLAALSLAADAFQLVPLTARTSPAHLHAVQPPPTPVTDKATIPFQKYLTTLTISAILASSLCLQPSFAFESSKVVGQLQGSGLVFKDTLAIERFDDPKVKGVTLYISNFQRPLNERLSNFLQDPSYASVACAKTGPIQVATNIATSAAGEQVFEESKSLLFKTLRVQRIYDVEKKTVVYVSYNTRLDKSDDANKSRFKSSLCAVNLEELTPLVSAAEVVAPAL